MHKASILIVEDEDKIAGVLRDYLVQAGHTVHWLRRGDAVEPWFREHHADLVLLDLMLPGRDGLSICRDLRQRHSAGSPAIIMVTARVEEVDRLLGLEAGADDYVCKPFSPREVVARVRAVLRRSMGPKDTHGLVVDLTTGHASLHGETLELTALELRLLHLLAAKPGRIFSRDELITAIYPDQREVVDRTIDSHIKKLRRKLEERKPDVEFIHSIYGLGYKYESVERAT